MIRADSDARIGTSHVMCCVALAEAWPECGGTVVLAAAHKVFEEIGGELDRGTLLGRLMGPVAHSGFSRLT